MDGKHFKFTKATLDKLPLPGKGKRVYYYDSGESGLALGVSGAGSKTFVVYRKIQGRPERVTLGRYPALSVAEARHRAIEIKLQIARGDNPNEARRRLRNETTLGDLFKNYLECHAKPHKRTWQEDEAQYKRYLSIWDKRRLSSLQRMEVEKLHKKIGAEHGRYAANRLLSLLRMLFGWAQQHGWEQANPASGIRQFRERSRERFLQADELPRFFAALEVEPNHAMRDYIMLSLLTGARKSNMLAMRWKEVDLPQALWRIPQTKNGTAQTIPLPHEAVAILRQRYAKRGKSIFVFPGNGKSGHITEPKSAWKRILQRAGLTDLRLHDLRRSLGSWQAATGANLSVIGKTLNHKDMKSTAVYARLDLAPVREAMQTAVSAMLATGMAEKNSGV